MNSIDDMIEAERVAYAKGDDDLSKLLLDCIQVAESAGEEAIEEHDSREFDEQYTKITDAVSKLEELQVEISEIIEGLE